MSKPVIFSLDDDPEVLGAIERDLRSHYSSSYRIIKANSAITAVNQLKSRNIPVALFIVDQRMPEMTALSFSMIVVSYFGSV
jgi:thioredoxin reductase (NADPH)